MKKRNSITGIIDSLERRRAETRDGKAGEAEAVYEGSKGADESSAGEDETLSAFDRAALKLGAALLERLGVSGNTDVTGLVESILEYWRTEPPAKNIRESITREMQTHENGKKNIPLPQPIRVKMNEAPEADYESMSEEQFRKLKKQLQRAAMDGRRIRI